MPEEGGLPHLYWSQFFQRRQDRWKHSSGTARIVALVFLLLVPPGPAVGQTDAEIEEVFWESVECGSTGQVELYLEIYPTGRYVAEAHECLEGQLGLEPAPRTLVQQGLASLGYAPGPADGQFGPATRAALRGWQAAKEFAATGYLTREQADALIALGHDAAVAQRQREEAERLAQEEAAARQAHAADDAAYAEAQQVDTAAAYGEYLAAYPAGRHADEARTLEATRLEEVRPAQADDAAYEEARRVDTAAAYGAYLAAYPQGRHVGEARFHEANRRAGMQRQAGAGVTQHPLDTREERLNQCIAQVENITETCKQHLDDQKQAAIGLALTPFIWAVQLLNKPFEELGCSGTPFRPTHGYCDTEAACMKKRCERDQDLPLGYLVK